MDDKDLFDELFLAFSQNDKEQIEILLDYIAGEIANGRSIKLSSKVLEQNISCAKNNELLFFQMLSLVGAPYSYTKIKSYPQKELTSGGKRKLQGFVSSGLSIEGMFYVYFNSPYKLSFNLDSLVDVMIDKGIASEEEILAELGKYWFSGEVVIVTDTGYTRIAPQNFGITRVVGVAPRNSFIIENGVQEPLKNGDELLFKIKSYNKEKCLFSAHYLCRVPKHADTLALQKNRIKTLERVSYSEELFETLDGKMGEYVELALNNLLMMFPDKKYTFKLWNEGGYILAEVLLEGRPYERYGYKKKGIPHFRQWID